MSGDEPAAPEVPEERRLFDTPAPEVPQVPPPAESIELVATLARGVGAGFRAMPRALPILLPVLVIAQAVTILGAPQLAMGPLPAPGHPAAEPALSDWLVLAGVMIFDLTIGTWAQCGALLACEAALEGEPVPDFAHAYGRGLERAPAAIGTTLAVAAAVLAGVLLCFVPGIWAMALLNFAILRAVVRGEGVRTAIAHSALLVRGRVWRILGAILLMVCVLMPLIGLTGLVEAILTTTGNAPTDTVSRLPILALAVVTGAVSSLLVMGMQLALHRRLEELGPKA